MRRVTHLLLFGLIAVAMTPQAQARKKKKLNVQVTKEDVDIAGRTIHFRLNRPADYAELQLFNTEGELVTEKMEEYDGAKSGNRLSITWPEIFDQIDNFKVSLKVTDVDGFWVVWEIVRFYIEIPHEEVVFETGKWDVRPSEAPKVDEALRLLKEAVAKYGRDMDVQLYVAGYTDTVGSLGDNRELSRQRARSIARYFRKHGLKKVPIFVRGFGEEALAVETGDSVAEERNRRALYILSTFPPEIAGPGAWNKI